MCMLLWKNVWILNTYPFTLISTLFRSIIVKILFWMHQEHLYSVGIKHAVVWSPIKPQLSVCWLRRHRAWLYHDYCMYQSKCSPFIQIGVNATVKNCEVWEPKKTNLYTVFAEYMQSCWKQQSALSTTSWHAHRGQRCLENNTMITAP